LSYLPDDSIRAAAEVVDLAALRVAARFAQGQIADEDDFTSRLLQAMQDGIDGLAVAGVRWQAEKVRSRGPGSDESLTGADILVRLDVNLPRVRYSKGFLAQAKIVGPGRPLGKLREQCEKMLRVSPDSFVWHYDGSGVHVSSALPFVGSTVGTRDVPMWPVRKLFDAHFRSFIGDRRLAISADLANLLDESPLDEIVISAGPIRPRR
jgi:hypothetical protein